MTNPVPVKILVFDSGVGGLSILQALQNKLPDCEYIYASDNQTFPYGTKTASFLTARVQSVLQSLIEKTHPDLIVVACNTASTLVLSHIRRHFTIPIVGVVPAIKPAVKLTKTRVIGLLGTPGTVKRDYTKMLLNEFATDCKIISVGSSELVELAEQALRGTVPEPAKLQLLLKPMFDNERLDTIVLACTHFPLIKDHLIGVSPRDVNWVDSGEAIARRVYTLLEKTFHTQANTEVIFHTAIFTKPGEDINLLKDALKTFKLENIEYL